MNTDQVREANSILEKIAASDVSWKQVNDRGFNLSMTNLDIKEIKDLSIQMGLTADRWFEARRDRLLEQLKALGVEAEGV